MLAEKKRQKREIALPVTSEGEGTTVFAESVCFVVVVWIQHRGVGGGLLEPLNFAALHILNPCCSSMGCEARTLGFLRIARYVLVKRTGIEPPPRYCFAVVSSTLSISHYQTPTCRQRFCISWGKLTESEPMCAWVEAGSRFVFAEVDAYGESMYHKSPHASLDLMEKNLAPRH